MIGISQCISQCISEYLLLWARVMLIVCETISADWFLSCSHLTFYISFISNIMSIVKWWHLGLCKNIIVIRTYTFWNHFIRKSLSQVLCYEWRGVLNRGTLVIDDFPISFPSVKCKVHGIWSMTFIYAYLFHDWLREMNARGLDILPSCSVFTYFHLSIGSFRQLDFQAIWKQKVIHSFLSRW